MSSLDTYELPDDPPADAEELCHRHGDILAEWAERDDKLGAIARAALRAGGHDDV